MVFQPGHNLATGRPPGAVTRRSEQLRIRLRERGDVDPADFCSSIVSSTTEPTELKLQAANYLLPYLYNKRGTMTPLSYIEEPVELPHPQPTSIDQTIANINYISARKAAVKLTLTSPTA